MGEDGLRVEGLVAPPVVLARIADENPNPAIKGGGNPIHGYWRPAIQC